MGALAGENLGDGHQFVPGGRTGEVALGGEETREGRRTSREGQHALTLSTLHSPKQCRNTVPKVCAQSYRALNSDRAHAKQECARARACLQANVLFAAF